ncbi:gas vesicle protein K [Streptomyces roseifaciens]
MPERDDRRPPDRGQDAAPAAARPLSMTPARPDELPPPLESPGRTAAERLHTDPDTVERDLVRLVLTIVELLRQLMERQALHRVDEGGLTEEQEERLGLTLMLLHDRMDELCERYGLTMADLNLDLGPLGRLL